MEINMEEKKDLNIEEKYKATITEDIRNLEIKKDNLNAQIHQLQIKKEGDKKVSEFEAKQSYVSEKNELVKKKNDLGAREESLELREARLREREQLVHKGEEVMGKIDERKAEVTEMWRDFNNYKDKTNKQLIEAMGVIRRAEEIESEINVKRGGLKALEKKLDVEKLELDRKVGIFEQKKLQYEKMKYQPKEEVVNV
jgi:hypothetical protein